jgi:hypothetical protein
MDDLADRGGALAAGLSGVGPAGERCCVCRRREQIDPINDQRGRTTKIAPTRLVRITDLLDDDDERRTAELGDGDLDPLLSDADMWAAGGVRDGDRFDHVQTVNSPPQGRVKKHGCGRGDEDR